MFTSVISLQQTTNSPNSHFSQNLSFCNSVFLQKSPETENEETQIIDKMTSDQDIDDIYSDNVPNSDSHDLTTKSSDKVSYNEATEPSNYNYAVPLEGVYNYMDMTEGSSNHNAIPNLEAGGGNYANTNQKETKGEYNYMDMTEGSTNYNTTSNLEDANSGKRDRKHTKGEYNYMDMTEGSTNYNTTSNLEEGKDNYADTGQKESSLTNYLDASHIEEPGLYNDLNMGEADDTRIESDPKSVTDAHTGFEPNTGAGTYMNPEPKTEGGIYKDPEPKTTADTYMDPEPKTAADTYIDPEPKAGAETYLDPDPKTAACTYIDPDLEIGPGGKITPDAKASFKNYIELDLSSDPRSYNDPVQPMTPQDVYQDTELDMVVTYGDIVDDASTAKTPQKEDEPESKTTFSKSSGITKCLRLLEYPATIIALAVLCVVLLLLVVLLSIKVNDMQSNFEDRINQLEAASGFDSQIAKLNDTIQMVEQRIDHLSLSMDSLEMRVQWIEQFF